MNPSTNGRVSDRGAVHPLGKGTKGDKPQEVRANPAKQRLTGANTVVAGANTIAMGWQTRSGERLTLRVPNPDTLGAL